MSSDIVLPKNNEGESIDIAIKLGLKKLYFLYDFDDYNEEKIQEKLDSIENKKIATDTGFIVNTKNINKAFKKSRFLVAKSSEKDRHMIESKKIKLIYGFEDSERKDYLHQRHSGLNHILCEMAVKNNVAIGFSYSSIINSSNSHIILGRMMQNLNLCKKYKTETVIASFSSNPFDLRSRHDIQSLFNLILTKNKRF